MKIRIWIAVMLFLAASGAGAWRPSPALSQEVNAGIIPLNEAFSGHTYQEWNAYYIDQKILPLYGVAPQHPDFNSPDVHFLAISQNDASEILETIPSGKASMLMIMNMLDNDDPVLNDSADEIPSIDRDLAAWKRYAERGSISCSIDGTSVQNLKEFVFKNKLAQKIATGEKHITYNWSIGVGLLLRPFAPGIHTIHVYSNIPEYGNFANETIYRIEAK
jgi:hypothetical protein